MMDDAVVSNRAGMIACISAASPAPRRNNAKRSATRVLAIAGFTCPIRGTYRERCGTSTSRVRGSSPASIGTWAKASAGAAWRVRDFRHMEHFRLSSVSYVSLTVDDAAPQICSRWHQPVLAWPGASAQQSAKIAPANGRLESVSDATNSASSRARLGAAIQLSTAAQEPGCS